MSLANRQSHKPRRASLTVSSARSTLRIAAIHEIPRGIASTLRSADIELTFLLLNSPSASNARKLDASATEKRRAIDLLYRKKKKKTTICYIRRIAISSLSAVSATLPSIAPS